MVETPLWLDMPGDTTIANVGERSIPIRTTGHDKGRFTVNLAAMANGRKLKPFVVFKGVRPIAEISRVSGVVVRLSHNGWMNESLTIEWLDISWGHLSFNRRMLIWDVYRCHMTDKVKRHAEKETKSELCIIPGGTHQSVTTCRCLLEQAFQNSIQGAIQQMMATGQKSFTVAGNMKALDELLCLQWVKEAWNSVSTEVIVKSFKVCGISVATDGSVDGEFHCLKEGEPGVEAAPIIRRQTEQLISSRSSDDLLAGCSDDLFACCDSELENNELVVDDD